MKLEIGKEYKVIHSRKGVFFMKVMDDDGEWVVGTITHGMADALLDYNVKHIGEEITVRKAFCKFAEEPFKEESDPLRHPSAADE